MTLAPAEEVFSYFFRFFSGFSDYAVNYMYSHYTFVCSVLSRESRAQAEALIQLRCVHSLMVAMGNTDYADSQRQAAITLAVGFIFSDFLPYWLELLCKSLLFQYFCRSFPIVDEHCREAMGETLYELFMVSTTM